LTSSVQQTRKIKAEANRLGFSLVGITHPSPPAHFPNFERWLADGCHAQMEYLATGRSRQRRADPRQILPQVRSILSLGSAYPIPKSSPSSLPTGNRVTGRVASYAWGADYHEVLEPRLKNLVLAIENETGSPVLSREYSDTGPVLERDYAQQAGLGWVGKNTCLINPRHGSYFLLSEIITDVELELDEPFSSDHCGSCTRCIEACPTGCIQEDRTIDAGRCISYLTIELKGSIPLDLRPKTGDWVFGCDICQEVCPWNQRFADLQPGPGLEPREELAFPDLHHEIFLTPGEFNQKFKNSPIRRAKRRGYLRNIAVALGNLADPASVVYLEQVLLDEVEPIVRGHAAWALGQIRTRAALLALEKALVIDPDPGVRSEIRTALDR